LYTLQFKEEEKEFESRREAIEAAKEMTDTSSHRAEISDELGVESLVYRYGEMEYYEYDTRRLNQLRRSELHA